MCEEQSLREVGKLAVFALFSAENEQIERLRHLTCCLTGKNKLFNFQKVNRFEHFFNPKRSDNTVVTSVVTSTRQPAERLEGLPGLEILAWSGYQAGFKPQTRVAQRLRQGITACHQGAFLGGKSSPPRMNAANRRDRTEPMDLLNLSL